MHALKPLLPAPEEAKPATVTTPGAWALFRTRGCWTLTLTRFFTDPVIYFVIFWLPEYLRKERHFDLAMVGKYSAVPFLFGGIGYLLGGWLSGYLMGRGWPLARARKFVMAMGAAVMPVAIFAPFVPTAALAIGGDLLHDVWTRTVGGQPADDPDRPVSWP